MKKISTIISLSKFEDLLAFGATLIVIGLFLITTIDATGRYFFGRAVTDGHQISEALLVVFVYLSVAFAQREKRHIHIDLISGKLSARNRLKLELLWLLIQFFAIGFLLYGSFLNAVGSILISEVLVGVTRISAVPFRLFVVVGLTTLIFRIIIQIVALISLLYGRKKTYDDYKSSTPHEVSHRYSYGVEPNKEG